MYSKSVFLIISHISRLVKGVDASKKGVSTNPDNYETFENMVISDKVARKHILSASVVIDLLNGKVLKNRHSVDDTSTFREYVDRYQQDIGAALRSWAAMNPDNYKKLKGIAGSAAGDQNDQTDINGH